MIIRRMIYYPLLLFTSIYCRNSSVDPKLAATPYRGYSTWSSQAIKGVSAYSDKPDGSPWFEEKALIQISDSLRAKFPGWEYINLDSGGLGDRDSNGLPQLSISVFPNGAAPVVSHLAANGQRLGTYLTPGLPKGLVAGSNTVIGHPECKFAKMVLRPLREANSNYDSWSCDPSNPCSALYYQSVAQQLANFGFGYVKIDFVGPAFRDTTNSIGDTRLMSDAFSDKNMW